MSKIRKLTPELLKKIIAEEKRKISNEKKLVRRKSRTSKNKKRKGLNELRALAKIKLEQKRAARRLKKLAEARRVLKRRIMRRL